MATLYVDDLRDVPPGCTGAKSVNQAKYFIQQAEQDGHPFTLIDLDHDAGDYAWDGGDYIRILDWLEATNRNYRIAIHTMNPVGRQQMERIVQKNGWKLIYVSRRAL